MKKLLPRCLKPWVNFEIDDGRESWAHVRPCCWSLKDVGDLSINSVQEIWNGAGYVEFRLRMLEDDLDGLCPASCPNLQPSSRDIQNYLSGLVRFHKRNDFINFNEILQREVKLKSSPVYMKVSPSLACNLRCIMCYQSHETSAHLSDETLNQTIDLLPNVRLLRIQGGEVFASKSGMVFLERIANLSNKPLIGLITNATFPIQGGMDLMGKLNLQWVICSLDTTCPDKYSKIRIGGDWEKVLENLKKITVKANYKQNYQTFLSMTVMTVNMKEIRDFLELAHSLNADAIINPLVPDELTTYLDPLGSNTDRIILEDSLQLGLDYAQKTHMPAATDSIKVLQDILRITSIN